MGAHLSNDAGPALSADSLQAGQSMFLTGSYTTTAGDVAINLQSARISGTFLFVSISGPQDLTGTAAWLGGPGDTAGYHPLSWARRLMIGQG